MRDYPIYSEEGRVDRLVRIEITKAELDFLASSALQAADFIDDWEFQTLIGITKSELEELIGDMRVRADKALRKVQEEEGRS